MAVVNTVLFTIIIILIALFAGVGLFKKASRTITILTALTVMPWLLAVTIIGYTSQFFNAVKYALQRVMSQLNGVFKVAFSILGVLSCLAIYPLAVLFDFFLSMCVRAITPLLFYTYTIGFVDVFRSLFPCLLVSCLPSLVSAADDASSFLKLDPTKRIPMLTETNYHDWSWRISTVFISLGVGSGLLTMYQQSHDISGAGTNADGKRYVVSEDIKKLQKLLKEAKLKKQLCSQDELENINSTIRTLKADLDTQIDAAVTLYQQESAKSPFVNLTTSLKIQCFRILTSTISPELDFLLMNYLPTQFEEAWTSVRDYFQTNTRGARMDAKLRFFGLCMATDMKLAEFKHKIEFTARQVNSMTIGVETISDDDKLTVLLRGVRQHHLHTFKTTLEILEQDSHPLTFEEAYKKLLVVERRPEFKSTSSAEHGMNATTQDHKSKQLCRLFQRGACRQGSRCKYVHNNTTPTQSRTPTTGNQGCTWCGGLRHTENVCNKKAAARQQARRSTPTHKPNHKMKTEIAALRKRLAANTVTTPPTEQKEVAESAVAHEWAFLATAEGSSTSTTAISMFYLFALLAMGLFLLWFFKFWHHATSSITNYSPVSLLSNKRNVSHSGISGRRQRAHRPKFRTKFRPTHTAHHCCGRIFTNPTKFQKYLLRRCGHFSILTNRRLSAQPTSFHMWPDTNHFTCTNFCYTASTNSSRHGGALDSGCTSHLFSSLEGFSSLQPCTIPITAAGGHVIHAEGRGDCQRAVKLPCGRTHVVNFKNSLYVPCLEYDLISTRRFDQEGCKTVFENNSGYVYDENGELLVYAALHQNLYCLLPLDEYVNAALPKIDLMHRRFGHLSPRYLTNWLDKTDSRKLSYCDACAAAKATRRPYRHQTKTRPQVRKPLDHVVCDVCGPFRTTSISGASYFAVLVDVFSRFIFVFFLRSKDEMATHISNWFTFIKTQTGKVPKLFQSDGGGEFTSGDTRAVFTLNGTKYVTTSPDSSNQNGIAERTIRSITEMARTLMDQADAPKYLWEEAVRYATLLKNITPHKATKMRTPMSRFPLAWYRSLPFKTGVRIWGCKCYVRLETDKLSSPGRPALFLGMDPVKKGWRVLLLESRKIVVSRNVTFDESNFPCRDRRVVSVSPPSIEVTVPINSSPGSASVGPADSNSNVPVPDVSIPVSAAASRRTTPREPSGAALRNLAGGDSAYVTRFPDDADDMPALVSDSDSDDDDYPGTSHTHTYTHSQNTSDDHLCFAARTKRPFPKRGKRDPDPTVPSSYKQAMASSEAPQWTSGMKTEYDALRNIHATWVEVPIAEAAAAGSTLLRCRWVYKKKPIHPPPLPPAPSFTYKCRLVVKGFLQRAGIDYDDVFSAVAQLKTFRLLVALAAQLRLKVSHLDFDNAFVQSELPKPVYMEHPEGFPGTPNTCLKLLKSLYGLKHAPRMWSDLLRAFLLSLGFVACLCDSCFYFHSTLLMFVVTWSDDILIAYANELDRNKIVSALSARFKLKDYGALSKYVGIEVHSDHHGGIFLSQPTYIRSMLKRFGLANCKPVNTPAVPGSLPSTVSEPVIIDDKTPYKSAVGSLWYAARGTRPDIEFATNSVAQFATKYTDVHWQAVKRVFRYLASCVSTGVKYAPQSTFSITAFCDSDWGGNIHTRRSTSGYVILVAGGPVIWSTKAQKSVALSSCEAEYYALVEVIKELLWLTQLLDEIKVAYDTPVIYVDNQGAIALAHNPVHHQRSKHIDIRYHFIRDAISTGKVRVQYVGTDKNIADMFTKALAAILFRKHTSAVMFTPPSAEKCNTLVERCLMARTKRTGRSGFHWPPPWQLVRSSLNEFQCYLHCQNCPAYIPYIRLSGSWLPYCVRCNLPSDHAFVTCFICRSLVCNDPGDDIYVCQNRDCTNSAGNLVANNFNAP